VAEMCTLQTDKPTESSIPIGHLAMNKSTLFTVKPNENKFIKRKKNKKKIPWILY
jgi:hypothetical protein